jgi:hypothetical protein
LGILYGSYGFENEPFLHWDRFETLLRKPHNL